MIDQIVIAGGGSAGFLTAITLKAKIPALSVTLIHSPEIGIIGVGEGTTISVPVHLHDYLAIDIAEFFRIAEPIWKMGIRFLWGKRPFFDYTFGFQLHSKYAVLPKHVGYYGTEDFEDMGVTTAMLTRNRVFERKPDGSPRMGRDFAYHLENHSFVDYLQMYARRLGVVIEEGTVADVQQDDRGISGLTLNDGRAFKGDLYIDCSGFRSILLGKAMQEPYISFASSLFCDRAVTGGWERAANEPIQCYTIAETMNHGWCWRIDHPARINRGYVYSSSFVSDADAEAELLAKNPRITKTRKVHYTTGRYERQWVKNVVAIGNAGGFVEPLESTGISGVCVAAQNLTEMLIDSERQIRPTLIRIFNHRMASSWDAIRQFLAVHYKFNRRLDTPFWQACREKTNLAGAESIVEFYQENGPTPIWHPTLVDRGDQFGAEGYLSMLLGMQVPFQQSRPISAGERDTWRKVKAYNVKRAQTAYSAEQMIAMIRMPQWSWGGYYK